MTQPTNQQPPVELSDQDEVILLGLLTNAYENPLWDDESTAISRLIGLFEDRIAERESTPA